MCAEEGHHGTVTEMKKRFERLSVDDSPQVGFTHTATSEEQKAALRRKRAMRSTMPASMSSYKGVETGTSIGQQMLRRKGSRKTVSRPPSRGGRKSTLPDNARFLEEKLLASQNIRQNAESAGEARPTRKMGNAQREATFFEGREHQRQNSASGNVEIFHSKKKSTTSTLTRKLSSITSSAVRKDSSHPEYAYRNKSLSVSLISSSRPKHGESNVGEIAQTIDIDVESLIGDDEGAVRVDKEEKERQSIAWQRKFSVLHEEDTMKDLWGQIDAEDKKKHRKTAADISKQPKQYKEIMKPVLYQSSSKLRSILQPQKEADWEVLSDLVKVKKTDRLKYVVRSGIPEKHRARMWLVLSGAEKDRKDNILTYADLVSKISDPKNAEFIEQIDKDLPRTVIGEKALEEGNESYAAIRRVLGAFAIYRPSIGYTQSMNYIAALLYLQLQGDEEGVFWMLHKITCDLFPGYWDSDMASLQVDQLVISDLIQHRATSLFDHLEENEMMQTVLGMTTNWFLCLFINSLPVETCIRIWDCIFFEGPKVLFRCVLALFLINQRTILLAESEIDSLVLIQDIPKTAIDPSTFLRFAFSIPSFSSSVITQLRSLHVKEIADKIKAEELARLEYIAKLEENSGEKRYGRVDHDEEYLNPTWRLTFVEEPPFTRFLVDEYQPL